MVYFITDSKIMFNICYGIIIGLPVRATPNQEKKKEEKCGQSSQKALRVPSPLQWGRFLRGGNGSFQIVWRTDFIGSRFGTNTKLSRAVTGPISTRNDYLNTVFDDVVSLRGIYGAAETSGPPSIPTGNASTRLQFSPCVWKIFPYKK